MLQYFYYTKEKEGYLMNTNNEIIFTPTETITITVYRNDNYNCPIFKIENDNECSNITEIIEDTLKIY